VESETLAIQEDISENIPFLIVIFSTTISAFLIGYFWGW